MKTTFLIIFSIMALNGLKTNQEAPQMNQGDQRRRRLTKNPVSSTTHNLKGVDASDELKTEQKIIGYLTRNQNKRLPLLLQEINSRSFSKMKKSHLLKPMTQFFKDALKIITESPENLNFNWFIFELSEAFKQLELSVTEKNGVAKYHNVVFKHYLRYGKVDALKFQYVMDGLLSFSPETPILHLQDLQKSAHQAFEVLQSFIVIGPKDRFAYEVLSGEKIPEEYQNLKQAKESKTIEKVAENNPKKKNKKSVPLTPIQAPLNDEDIERILYRNTNFLKTVPKSKSGKEFFDFFDFFTNQGTMELIPNCLTPLYHLYEKGGDMYIGRENFAFQDHNELYKVNGYLYRGVFYKTLQKYIEGAQNCLADHYSLKNSRIKKLFQIINAFELYYKKIDLLYRNKDYVEVYAFKFKSSIPKSERKELMNQFYLMKFGKSYDDKVKNDKEFELQIREKMIKKFKRNKEIIKDEEETESIGELDLLFEPQDNHLGFIDKSEEKNTQTQASLTSRQKTLQEKKNILQKSKSLPKRHQTTKPKVTPKENKSAHLIQRQKPISKKPKFQLKFKKTLIPKSVMLKPLISIEQAYEKSSLIKSKAKFHILAKKLMDAFNQMLSGLSIQERHNGKKYQIVYRYENKDYKEFYALTTEITHYLIDFKTAGFKTLTEAFTKLQDSLFKFKVTRNQSYESIYFGENGKKTTEAEFNKGLKANNVLKDVKIQPEESEEEEEEQSDQKDPDWVPSAEQEKDRAYVEINRKSHSIDLNSEETSFLEEDSELVPSEEKEKDRAYVEINRKSHSIDLDSEESSHLSEGSEWIPSEEPTKDKAIVKVNGKTHSVDLSSEEKSDLVPSEEQTRDRAVVEINRKSHSIDLESEESSQKEEDSEYLPSGDQLPEKNDQIINNKANPNNPKKPVNSDSGEKSDLVPSEERERDRAVVEINRKSHSIDLESEESSNHSEPSEWLPSGEQVLDEAQVKINKTSHSVNLSSEESSHERENPDLVPSEEKEKDVMKVDINRKSHSLDLESEESTHKREKPDLVPSGEQEKDRAVVDINRKPHSINLESEESEENLDKKELEPIQIGKKEQKTLSDERQDIPELISEHESQNIKDINSYHIPSEEELEISENSNKSPSKKIGGSESEGTKSQASSEILDEETLLEPKEMKETKKESSVVLNVSSNHREEIPEGSNDQLKNGEQKELKSQSNSSESSEETVRIEEPISSENTQEILDKDIAPTKIDLPVRQSSGMIEEENLDSSSERKNTDKSLDHLQEKELAKTLRNPLSGETNPTSPKKTLDFSEESLEEGFVNTLSLNEDESLQKSEKSNSSEKKDKDNIIKLPPGEFKGPKDQILESENSKKSSLSSPSLTESDKFSSEQARKVTTTPEESIEAEETTHEPKSLNFDLTKLNLSSLKVPLEELEKNGKDLSLSPELIDSINVLWKDLIDQLDSYKVKIRKEDYQIYKFPTQKLMQFQNQLKELSIEKPDLVDFTNPVTKAILLNFMKLREHSFERILLEKDGVSTPVPASKIILPLENITTPDLNVDLEIIPESDLKDLTQNLFDGLNEEKDNLPADSLPLLKILKNKLMTVLNESEETFGDKWFTVVDFPKEKIPSLEDVLEQLVIALPKDDPKIDLEELEKISDLLLNLMENPQSIKIKKVKGNEVDDSPFVGPLNLDSIPESKLVKPLEKLEKFAFQSKNEMAKNPEFAQEIYQGTLLFNGMLEANKKENMDQGKYFFDRAKFFQLIGVLGQIELLNKKYNDPIITEIADEINELQIFDIEEGGNVSEIFDPSIMEGEDLKKSMVKIDIEENLPSEIEKESSIQEEKPFPQSTEQKVTSLMSTEDKNRDADPQLKKETPSARLETPESESSSEEGNPTEDISFEEEDHLDSRKNTSPQKSSFLSEGEKKDKKSESKTETMDEESQVHEDDLEDYEKPKIPLELSDEEPEIIRVVLIEIVDCEDCLDEGYIKLE